MFFFYDDTPVGEDWCLRVKIYRPMFEFGPNVYVSRGCGVPQLWQGLMPQLSGVNWCQFDQLWL